jgi:hypothetical protein
MASKPKLNLQMALQHAKQTLSQPAKAPRALEVPVTPKRGDEALTLEKFAKAWVRAKNIKIIPH